MGNHVVAITGASGAKYGVRLIEILHSIGHDIRLIISREGAINLKLECDIAPEELADKYGCTIENNQNLAAKSASGSAKIDSVIVCPASGTTISKIAAGISDNLATRSAIVALKERRTLILVPREAPYATVHLENMTKISQWGGVILPASPGFYNNPSTIEDLVDFVVARILDQIGIDNDLTARWTGDEVKSE
ncbi:MAG: aromatic acid decarboxylase [Euryarchaeota archaeon]|nr:aromatic acid decarboxylase [Euryarchaeota archaeon]